MPAEMSRRRLFVLVGLNPDRADELSRAAHAVGNRVELAAGMQDALAFLAAVVPDEVIVPSDEVASLLEPSLHRLSRLGLPPALVVDRKG